jgi:hypothetical protein
MIPSRISLSTIQEHFIKTSSRNLAAWTGMFPCRALGAMGAGLLAAGVLTPAQAFITVNRGTDYVATPREGAQYQFQVSSGHVVALNFNGLAIGTPTTNLPTPPNPDGGFNGEADTVINRYQDVKASGESTNIEVVGLSLSSTTLFNYGGQSYNVFAGLQKYYGDPTGSGLKSEGTMTINDTGGLNGKTWSSSFTIHGVAVFVPAGTITTFANDFVRTTIQNITTPKGDLNELYDCQSNSRNFKCYLFTKEGFAASNEPWSNEPLADTILGENLVNPFPVADPPTQNFYMTNFENIKHDAGDGVVHNVSRTPVPQQAIVPGPLPILGAPMVLAFTRRLDKLSSRLRQLQASQ